MHVKCLAHIHSERNIDSACTIYIYIITYYEHMLSGLASDK